MSNMKFLLDENIPKRVKNFLESKGYTVEWPPKGIKNQQLASLPLDKGYVLLTRDYDFANTISYPPKQFHGIIVPPHTPSKRRETNRRNGTITN